MAKFKKGDRVRVTKDLSYCKKGTVYVVNEDDSRAPYVIFPGSEKSYDACIHEKDLELVPQLELEDRIRVVWKTEGAVTFERFPDLQLITEKPEEKINLVEEINKPKKTIMSKLNTMMKKLLDADTQTLVKAGYINGDLELTCEGQNALNTINFIANKAALVEAAAEKLAEEK